MSLLKGLAKFTGDAVGTAGYWMNRASDALQEIGKEEQTMIPDKFVAYTELLMDLLEDPVANAEAIKALRARMIKVASEAPTPEIKPEKPQVQDFKMNVAISPIVRSKAFTYEGVSYNPTTEEARHVFTANRKRHFFGFKGEQLVWHYDGEEHTATKEQIVKFLAGFEGPAVGRVVNILKVLKPKSNQTITQTPPKTLPKCANCGKETGTLHNVGGRFVCPDCAKKHWDEAKGRTTIQGEITGGAPSPAGEAHKGVPANSQKGVPCKVCGKEVLQLWSIGPDNKFACEPCKDAYYANLKSGSQSPERSEGAEGVDSSSPASVASGGQGVTCKRHRYVDGVCKCGKVKGNQSVSQAAPVGDGTSALADPRAKEVPGRQQQSTCSTAVSAAVLF